MSQVQAAAAAETNPLIAPPVAAKPRESLWQKIKSWFS